MGKISNRKILVDCKSESIFINGKELEFPIHMNDLVELFGEPSRKVHDLFWRVMWDEIGVYTHYPTWDYITSVQFLLSQEHQLKHLPTHLFDGEISFNGENFIASQEKRQSFGSNLIKKMTSKEAQSPYAISIAKDFSKEEKIPDDKYLLKPLQEEVVEFEDFGFKIAVIQELMYTKNLLKPKFDLYEFAKWYKNRKIDLEKEGYEPIKEVTEYFRDLPIPKRLAPELTEIIMDGGNKIYTQLICFPEGDENYWNIKSANDAKHFPNLKKVVLSYANKHITADLNNLGIDTSWI